MTFAEAVAKRTKDLMFGKQISQYRLIKLTMLDKSTLQAIFKGKTKDIKLSTIFLIADALGMTLSEFFNAEYFDNANLDY